MILRKFTKPLLITTLTSSLGIALGVAVTVPYSSARERAQAKPAQPSSSGSWCAERCDGVITDWNLTAFQVIKAADGYQDPMAASRSLAMMHLAMHDAVNAVVRRYQSHAFKATPAATADADPTVAAAVAAHDVLAGIYPQAPAQALLRAELQKTLFDAGLGRAVEAGTELGKAAAAAMLVSRQNDGSTATEPYVVRAVPGQYRYTPPFEFAAAPHWRAVTPFALARASQYRSAPPPALESDEYRQAFDEVKRVGAKQAGAARTPDEAHYAAFWYEFSDIGWNRIARLASTKVHQDLADRARTFALLNMAMADAYIAGWDSKYHYNFWRPVTAIQRAGDDRNPHTSAEPGFETLLPSPPVPDMPSTHSALGMAAATVLAHAFGRDQVAFSFASPSANPESPRRSYRSFSEAARENAESRIKAGLHFRFATKAGLEMGKRIGEHVTHHALNRQSS